MVLIGEAADLMNEALGAFVPVLRGDMGVEEAVLEGKKRHSLGIWSCCRRVAPVLTCFRDMRPGGIGFAAAVVGLRERVPGLR